MLPNFSSGFVCLSLCRFITLLLLPQILPRSLLKLLLSLGNNVYFLYISLLTVPSFSASTFSNCCSSVGRWMFSRNYIHLPFEFPFFNSFLFLGCELLALGLPLMPFFVAFSIRAPELSFRFFVTYPCRTGMSPRTVPSRNLLGCSVTSEAASSM